ncbi:MAG TPA: 4a-hydroxytetrahydrobiopterin dehydratase [Candidatus Paceibacterota bacterium]
MSKDLLKKVCKPCEGGVTPLNKADAQDYLDEVPGWELIEDGKKISKEFKFQDFIGAINFVERVADVAEMEDHHPDIHVYYNKVILELWTHAIGGLSLNDFIVAAKVDQVK